MASRSRREGRPFRAKQWFVRMDAWAECGARPMTMKRLGGPGHCNRSAMRLLGREPGRPWCGAVRVYPYLLLRASSRNPRADLVGAR